MGDLPRRFLEQIFYKRREFIENVIKGNINDRDFAIVATRHNPAFATYGPAGLNVSVKGVGFVVKEEFLEETIEKLKEAAFMKENAVERLKTLLELVYNEERIDFSKLITLELAKKHTWKNLKDDGGAVTLLYFIPPDIAFEVRCKAEVHLNGPYFEYANIIHDFYHAPHKVGKRCFPTYVLTIKEIYDNSVDSFGKKIYPKSD